MLKGVKTLSSKKKKKH